MTRYFILVKNFTNENIMSEIIIDITEITFQLGKQAASFYKNLFEEKDPH
jgi:hypothetical protein